MRGSRRSRRRPEASRPNAGRWPHAARRWRGCTRRSRPARREARSAALEKDVRNRAYEVAETKRQVDEALISANTARDGLDRDKAVHELAKKEFEAKADRFNQDIQHRSQELDAQRASLESIQSKLTEARDAFEAMREEKTQWIASKDIELEAREHTLSEKEVAVRGQAEANARQLTDLASREEAYEVEGDRLEKARSELGARK